MITENIQSDIESDDEETSRGRKGVSQKRLSSRSDEDDDEIDETIYFKKRKTRRAEEVDLTAVDSSVDSSSNNSVDSTDLPKTSNFGGYESAQSRNLLDEDDEDESDQGTV